jgi:hypothetical protein
MQRIEIAVPEPEYEVLSRRLPQTGKSSDIGRRAVELVKLHFKSLDPQCNFREQVDAFDLQVTRSTGEVERLEVKGTASFNLDWARLKVSGIPSHSALASGTPLYRVTGVYARVPVIFVMRFPEDFRLEPEPRWSVRPTINRTQYFAK